MIYKSSKYNIVVDERTSDESKLIFNTKTSALSWLTPNLHVPLMAGDNNLIVNSIYSENMKKCGYIIPDFLDEFEEIYFKRYQYTFAKTYKRRLFVIAPTLKCNLKCIYCYEEGQELVSEASFAKMEEIYNFIVNEAEKNEKPNEIHITWFGGEPLLKLEIVNYFSRKMIDYCDKNNISYSAGIITNGLLLSKENIGSLKNDCKISKIQITIDGTEPFYTVYKKATAAQYESLLSLLPLLAKEFSIAIRLNASVENKFGILDIASQLFADKTICENARIYVAPIKNYKNNAVTLFHSLNYDELSALKLEFYKLAIQYSAKKSLEQLLPKAKIVFCGSMQNLNCAIDPMGYLYRCEHCLGRTEWAIGDVQNGFYHNHQDNLFLMRPVSPKCRSCSYFPVCATGCAAEEILNNFEFDCEAFQNAIIQQIKVAAQVRNLITLPVK